jgi:hypothetical protein
MIGGAFSRSRALMGAPHGKQVSMAMEKWWKKVQPAEAEVSELCPARATCSFLVSLTFAC